MTLSQDKMQLHHTVIRLYAIEYNTYTLHTIHMCSVYLCIFSENLIRRHAKSN